MGARFRIHLVGMLLLSSVILAGSSGCSAHSEPRPSASNSAPAPPNIIFILTDDPRWDAVGCMGHPFLKTPNLDRIAREGAKFTNYFVTIPLCSPSRACILSGQYAHKHGIIDNGFVINRDELSFRLHTVAQLLQHAAYKTPFIGKWHMGDSPRPRPGWD